VSYQDRRFLLRLHDSGVVIDNLLYAWPGQFSRWIAAQFLDGFVLVWPGRREAGVALLLKIADERVPAVRRYPRTMIFDQGHLRLIEPWHAPLYKSDAKAACPALVFLQLLFGYRSLDELRYAFPDIEGEGVAEVLLKALFPRKFSWVLPLG